MKKRIFAVAFIAVLAVGSCLTSLAGSQRAEFYAANVGHTFTVNSGLYNSNYTSFISPNTYGEGYVHGVQVNDGGMTWGNQPNFYLTRSGMNKVADNASWSGYGVRTVVYPD